MGKTPRRRILGTARIGKTSGKGAVRKLKASELLLARVSGGKSLPPAKLDTVVNPTAGGARAPEATKRAVARKPGRKATAAVQSGDGLASVLQSEARVDGEMHTLTEAVAAASRRERRKARKSRASGVGDSSPPTATSDTDVAPGRKRRHKQSLRSSTGTSEVATALSKELAEFSRSLIEDSSSRANELIRCAVFRN